MDGMLHFMVRKQCVVCCMVCTNEKCSLCGTYDQCDRCKNTLCVNRGYDCLDYNNCERCKNTHCVNNSRFSAREVFLKYC